MREDIIGVLVTYNPNIADLYTNVRQISSQIDRLIVVDNFSENRDAFASLEKIENVTIIYNSENFGLGKAYNIALDKYLKDYKYFVTFDQDTFIPDNTLKLLSEVLDANDTIGVVGPLFSREESETSNNGRVIFKDSIIQSSSVFRSDLFKKIGGFKEDYFIDSVDFEYCLRILKNNYKVAIYSGVVIKHTLGELSSRYGMKYYSHSAFRNFYIARNHVKISIEYYKRFPKFVFKKNLFFMIHFFKLLFLEQNKSKLVSFFKGIKEGI